MKSRIIEIYKQAPSGLVKRHRMPVLVFAVVLILSDSCSNDSLLPVVASKAINLELGYEGSFGPGATFVAFKNQNQISVNDLLTSTQMTVGAEGIEIGLKESGASCKTLGYVNNQAPDSFSLEFLFNLSTSNDFPRDKEIFVTGKNGWIAAIGQGWNPNDNCSIELHYVFPIKIASHFIVNNDTLEINPSDTVKIAYRSLYTSKTISAKLAVTQ